MKRIKKVITEITSPSENQELENLRLQLLGVYEKSKEEKVEKKIEKELRKASFSIFTKAKSQAVKSSQKLLVTKTKELLKGVATGKSTLEVSLFELASYYEKTVDEMEQMSKTHLSKLYTEKLKEDLFINCFKEALTREIGREIEKRYERNGFPRNVSLRKIIVAQMNNVPADELISVYENLVISDM